MIRPPATLPPRDDLRCPPRMRYTGGVSDIDWAPDTAEILDDQVASYDRMREQCPVARDASGTWTVFKHADVSRVLGDFDTFSNVVSGHLAVPNGMDPPQHGKFRTIVDRYFTAGQMAALEPAVRLIAAEVVADLGDEVEAMAAIAQPYASRCQCEFMGWPPTLNEPLRQWITQNHAAIRAHDREAMSAVATAFDGRIKQQLDVRRATGGPPATPDPTTELLQEHVDGRALTDEEIVSIVRNWTVGELGTIAASVGIVLQFLATHPDVQSQLRADGSLIEPATDEMLRLHAPLTANRRRTTRPVTLGGRHIPRDAPVTVVWASANRDEDIFDDPYAFRLDRDPALNLLYGWGIHQCPGAPLARLELRILVEEIFAATEHICPVTGTHPTTAVHPAAGFATLPLRLR